MVGAKSRQALRGKKDEGWVLREYDDELAEHPYYKAGRPGRDAQCVEDASSNFTQRTRLQRKSNVSPHTIFRASLGSSNAPTLNNCCHSKALAPLSRRLGTRGLGKAKAAAAPKHATFPLWALARDAGTILTVDVLWIVEARGILRSLSNCQSAHRRYS